MNNQTRQQLLELRAQIYPALHDLEKEQVYIDMGPFDSSRVMLVMDHYDPNDHLGAMLFRELGREFLDIPGFGATGARLYLMEFLEHFHSEIRKIICKNDRGTKKRLDATCAALAAFFAKKFQIVEPVCVGIATYLLIMLLEATKGAFCKMTKDQVKAVLDPMR